MSLWSRLGFLIPICWVLGFVIVYFADKMFSGFIPEKWTFTLGHLLGTIFVWIFSLSFGVTKIKEVVDVETGEKSIIERPHNFLMISPLIWGLLMTLAVGWFFYQPPPKSWLDKAFMQKDALQKKLSEVGSQAKEKVTGEAVFREWTNQEGKKVRAKFLRIETTGGEKSVVFAREKDNKEFTIAVKDLSPADQEYVSDKEPNP